MGLTGCDYWPPALQTQIEQLRSELQTTTAEKAQLQTQLASLSKVKDDLQTQVDDLNRSNRDKSTMIASLQSSVTALQERLNKPAKPAVAKSGSAKAPPKVIAKAAPGKKSVPKKTGAR
jgi:chromosome segregation ATPase